mgnify:CR=1 FL=1
MKAPCCDWKSGKKNVYFEILTAYKGERMASQAFSSQVNKNNSTEIESKMFQPCLWRDGKPRIISASMTIGNGPHQNLMIVILVWNQVVKPMVKKRKRTDNNKNIKLNTVMNEQWNEKSYTNTNHIVMSSAVSLGHITIATYHSVSHTMIISPQKYVIVMWQYV